MKSLVLITGATGGLGKAFAAECAQRGWDLFLTDLSEERLKSLAGGLTNAYGVNVIYLPCDLTDTASRTKLIENIKNRGLCFWALINVAGIDYEGYFADRTVEQIRTILSLNIESTVEMTRAMVDFRDRSKTFRLITVSSMAAYYPMPVKALYAASKRFLLDFSLAFREEIRHLGGTVTVLCPSGMPTTELTIKAIDAQGFWGYITTSDVGYVASHTIDYALKGRAVYVPGGINRFIRFMGNLVPPTLVSRIIGWRWALAYQKSHADCSKEMI